MKAIPLVLSVFFSVPALAYDVTLAWDAVTDDRVVAYQLYWQPGSGPFVPIQRISVPTTQASVTGLDDGVPYSFYVTAVDATPLESDPSNMVTYVALPKATLDPARGLTVTVKTGNTYVIEQSFDLTTWTQLTQVTAQSDVINVPVDFTQPRAFFRVRKV